MRSTPEKSWTGRSVDLAVDAEVVVEDGVGPHGPHAQLVVGQPQRLGELVADVPAAAADAVVELRQAFGADHRPPRTVQRTASRAGGDLDAARARHRRPTASPPAARWLGWPWSSTAATAATVYHAGRPGVPVVSVSGGCGTGRTHGSPISNGDVLAVDGDPARRTRYPAAPSTGSQSSVTCPRPGTGDDADRRRPARQLDAGAGTALGRVLLPRHTGVGAGLGQRHLRPVVAMPRMM